eukprot:COSAG01_NODE_21712_length_888_cov_4.768061_1_plen_201_part_01
MKLRVRSTAGAVVEVSVPASATVQTFQQAAAQALGVAQIRHVLYKGQVMRPAEKRLRVYGVRNRHELVVIVGQHFDVGAESLFEAPASDLLFKEGVKTESTAAIPVRNSDVIPFDVGADSLFDSTSDSESAHLTSAALMVPSPDPRSGGGDLLFKEGDKVMLAPTTSAKSSQEGPLKMDVQGTIVAVDRQHADDDEPYQVL